MTENEEEKISLEEFRLRSRKIEITFEPMNIESSLGLFGKRMIFKLTLHKIRKELVEFEIRWRNLSSFYSLVGMV